jgi:hypothetical protein
VKKLLILFLCYSLGCARTAPFNEYPRDIQGTCPMALETDFQGVWTNPNAHSKVPAGAASRAENIVNPRPGVAECVPGQQNMAAGYEESDERFSSGTTYQGLLVESTSGATPRLYRRDVGTGTLTPYATAVSPPTDVVRMPFAEAGAKLYLATDGGVKVIDGVAAEPVAVGAPIPIGSRWDATGLVNVGSGTGVSASSAVALRWTFVREVVGGTQESAPSGRIVIDNTNASPADLKVTINLPAEVVAGDSIRLYKTGEVATTISPGDIMSLSYTHKVIASDVTNKYVQITDTSPSELRGAALYTNATSEGISRQNERPPYAALALSFDDALLLANVRGPQRLQFRMLAPPSAGDVFTIAGTTYTAKNYTDPSDPDYSDGEFETTTGGGVSQSIYDSSLALIDAINRTTANTSVYAYYASGEQDPPGIIQMEARDITAAAFTVAVSANGERYEPSLAAAASSSATTEPNGIWGSKRGQPYAFPPLRSTSATYRFRVGVKGGDILAWAAIKDAVIVFVDKEGVFKVKRTGAESWRVDQINANANLLVPGSVVVVDNQVLALTTRGLVAVDEGGVEEIDLPIKDKFDDIKKLDAELLRLYSFAVGDEARLRYIFYHPIAGQTGETPGSFHAWVYNADNGTWTERTDAASGGMVSPDDGRLYLGAADANTLTQERVGTPEEVFKTPANAAIPFRLTWTVKDEGDPGAEKQFTELRLLTREAFTGDVTFNCTNDLGGSESTTGSTGAEGEPFVRVWVPDGCQRTSRLTVDIQRNVLEEAFEVVGMKSLIAGMYDGGLRR